MGNRPLDIVPRGLRAFGFIFGLAFMALGVTLSIKSGLGTSPISSVPYVLSLMSPLSLGSATVMMNCFFILMQIAILRKQYKPAHLLQLPAVLIFGCFLDAMGSFLYMLNYTSYGQQWLICFAGIALTGLGISLMVNSNLIVLPPEGMMLVIYVKMYGKIKNLVFGYVKIAFDLTLIAIAVALCLALLPKIQGVREGTLAAACLTGYAVKIFDKLFDRLRIFKKN
ncbi:hypothetical protein C4J81_09795 [Deltaproteobacteria bacterium Smac51]|nr:hypothetical protein C4J81_09795 [Deltaproteobacteria bacterium Smac51]